MRLTQLNDFHFFYSVFKVEEEEFEEETTDLPPSKKQKLANSKNAKKK